MLESTARPLVQQPAPKPVHKSAPAPAPHTHIAFSRFEKTMMFACG
ncbi:cell division protein FtsL, partial [Paenibacillus polymyxa]|nr:cell division protein FtsL [Paenibacillus polymyxa]